ncbi:unnamed protein product [Thelazia callipaeda]|uniref:Exonuclease domain-containing protein n=1 Tax=Thelazia callipaeda TaxID=103827 RepID=A0A158RCQ6_THECL|nr:unnamed protein product [Thelazia callipaeda]
MLKAQKKKEKRKWKQLRKELNEAALVQEGDPSLIKETSQSVLENSANEEDSFSEWQKRLRTMRHLKNPPKISMSFNGLNGLDLGSRTKIITLNSNAYNVRASLFPVINFEKFFDIAELVHYVTFRNVEKPLWIAVQPSRGVLQTVVFRFNCDVELVVDGKENTYMEKFFGINTHNYMLEKSWNKADFWADMLNVSVSRFDSVQKILNNAGVLERHINSNMNRKILVDLREMVNRCFPFPTTNLPYVEEFSLPPVVPTKVPFLVSRELIFQEKYSSLRDDSPFFAIDCEMCTTERGESELTRISVVNENYEVLLDTLVKPRNKITDYVTKYSGITEQMLEDVDVRIDDVQKALSHILPSDAILVGHTLECDFNALRITHPYCVDISLCMNLSGDERQRSSLKTLAKIFLGEEIQRENGHCSVEDATITMRLLNVDFGNVLMGWSFNRWALANGISTSGAIIKDKVKPYSNVDINQRKKLCLNNEENIIHKCDKCRRPLSVACIVPNCACKQNVVKYCVICCLHTSIPHVSNESTFHWSDVFEANVINGFKPISHHLQLEKNKSAFYALPGYMKKFISNKHETFVDTDSYNSLDDLVRRVNEEVISHDIVMVDFDVAKLCSEPDGAPLYAVDDALKQMISFASLNSLIILVLSSPQESVCHVQMKTQIARKIPSLLLITGVRGINGSGGRFFRIYVAYSLIPSAMSLKRIAVMSAVHYYKPLVVSLCQKSTASLQPKNKVDLPANFTVFVYEMISPIFTILNYKCLEVLCCKFWLLKETDGKHEKTVPSMFRTSVPPQPINLNYPNRFMKPNFDPEVDLKNIVMEMPHFIWDNAVEVSKDVKSHFGIFKPSILEDFGNLRHGQFRKDILFKTPESFKCWRTGADSDSNEGFSKCEFIPTDRKTALFRGNLSTELLKDGKVERAGWAAIKFEERGPFFRKRYFRKWCNYSHFLIKCRGDGRTYKIILNSPLFLDVTWGNSHSYYLHTHGGPYWQYEAIPFSKFIFTIRNRIMDRQHPVNNANVSSLLIMLMDRIDGDFSLEIDYIGVVHDRTHLEEHAYESYQLPILYTEARFYALWAWKSWMSVKWSTGIRFLSTKILSPLSARIVLKNINWFTGEKDLENYFGRFGKVQHVKLVYEKETGLHKGYAFITFECIEDALKVVQQGIHHIDRRKAVAKIAVPLGKAGTAVKKTFNSAHRNSKDLFVKRISWVTGAKELSDYFSQFGKITNITLPFDLKTGLHKSYAFISFQNSDFYENIKKFQGKHIIDDEEVILTLANEVESLSLDASTLDPAKNKYSSKMNILNSNKSDDVVIEEFIKAEDNVESKKTKIHGKNSLIGVLNLQDNNKHLKQLDYLNSGKGPKNDNGLKKAVLTILRDPVKVSEEGSNDKTQQSYTVLRRPNKVVTNSFRDFNKFSDGAFKISSQKWGDAEKF